LEQIFAIIFSLPPLETLLATGVLVVLGIFNRKYRTFATYTLTNFIENQLKILEKFITIQEFSSEKRKTNRIGISCELVYFYSSV